MSNKLIFTLVIIFSLVIGFGLAIILPEKPEIRLIDGDSLGITTRSGLDVTGDVVFKNDLSVTGDTAIGGDLTSGGSFVQGGGILSLATTSNALTLTAAQMAAYNIIDVMPNVLALTLTLPATSTMTTLLPNAGDYANWVIRNATSSAMNVTIAAGAGIDLQEPDGQNVVIGTTNFAWATCFRKTNTDVVCRIDETIPAD